MLQMSIGKLQCVMQCTCVIVLMCVCLNTKCFIIVKKMCLGNQSLNRFLAKKKKY